jgi:hypothetical protein
MNEKPKVFISSASRDYGAATELAAVLAHELVSTFAAAGVIKAGEDWNEELRQAILDCDEVIVLCGPEVKKSEWVLMEIGAAWALKKRITPVILGAKPKQIPEHLRRIQFAYVRNSNDLSYLVSQIVARHQTKPEPLARLPIVPKELPSLRPNFHACPDRTASPYIEGWVKCPSCNFKFKLSEPSKWDGLRHQTCGQRLHILEP